VRKLNLGSGAFYKGGYVNVDLSSTAGADVVHDLSEFPYPFDDDEFDLDGQSRAAERIAADVTGSLIAPRK